MTSVASNAGLPRTNRECTAGRSLVNFNTCQVDVSNTLVQKSQQSAHAKSHVLATIVPSSRKRVTYFTVQSIKRKTTVF